MLGMHLKQPGFAYSACGLFTKVLVLVLVKVLVLFMLFKKYQIIQNVNLMKYGLIKEANFTITLLKNG